MNAFTSGLRRSLASNVKSLKSATTALAIIATSSTLLVVSQQDETPRISPVLCENQKLPRDGNKLIFLGSGSSTGCPVGECLFLLPQTPQHPPEKASRSYDSTWALQECKVSHLASQGDPRFNKNYRNNPSFLIHHYHEGSYKNIIIDVGKTFREGALRWFPEFCIQSLDAIILTHEHMDAAAGLDDVRGFQPRRPGTDDGPPSRKPVPLYLSQHCHDIVSSQFPFLLPKNKTTNPPSSCCCSSDTPELVPVTPPATIVHRDVAGFEVNIFKAFEPMMIEGLKVIPLPVWHGDDLISYGFAFSVKREDDSFVNVVYLSDISRMVDETFNFIQENLPPTDILVIDALLWNRKHPTHYSLQQAVELRDQIKPRMGTYLVGMSCESYPPHDEMAEHLKTTYGDVMMAHDGLCIALE